MTILYLYYNQPEAIEFLESIGYPDYDVDFVFVDDGSKVPLKLDWPNATVLRIEEDIPWNLETASNIGFSKVSGLVLRMGIDHYLTPDEFHELKKIKVDRGTIATFMRNKVNRDGSITEIGEPTDIYMINVEDFWAVDGYDEQYVGNYGYGGNDIKMKFHKAGYRKVLSEVRINVDTRFETKGLSRDTSINYAKYINKWR